MGGARGLVRASTAAVLVLSNLVSPRLADRQAEALAFDGKFESATTTPTVPGVSVAHATATAVPSTGEVIAITDADQQVRVPVTVPQVLLPVVKAEGTAIALVTKKLAVTQVSNVMVDFTGISASSSMSGLTVDFGMATQLGFANMYLEVNYFPCALGSVCNGSLVGANHLTLTQSGSLAPSSATLKVEGVPGAGHIEVRTGLWAGSTAQGGPSQATGRARAVVSAINICAPKSCPNATFRATGLITNYRLEASDPLEVAQMSRASFTGTTASPAGALAANVRVESDWEAGMIWSGASYGAGGRFASVYSFIDEKIDADAGSRTASATINITNATTFTDPTPINIFGFIDRDAQTYAAIWVFPYSCPQGKPCGYENATAHTVLVQQPGTITLSAPAQLSSRGYVLIKVLLYSQAQAAAGVAEGKISGSVTSVSVT